VSNHKGDRVKNALHLTFLLAFVVAQPVLAQVTPGPAVAPDTSMVAPEPARALPAVPKLNITWDCGDCEHNDKVIPLIEQAYAAEAAKNSFAISQTDVAEVAVTDIRQRPPGVRVMFGIMAGKDRLALRIRHLDREYTVSDTSVNIIMGLNYLSESVGKKTYAELARRPVQ
jgi:hypothetical protein